MTKGNYALASLMCAISFNAYSMKKKVEYAAESSNMTSMKIGSGTLCHCVGMLPYAFDEEGKAFVLLKKRDWDSQSTIKLQPPITQVWTPFSETFPPMCFFPPEQKGGEPATSEGLQKEGMKKLNLDLQNISWFVYIKLETLKLPTGAYSTTDITVERPSLHVHPTLIYNLFLVEIAPKKKDIADSDGRWVGLVEFKKEVDNTPLVPATGEDRQYYRLGVYDLGPLFFESLKQQQMKTWMDDILQKEGQLKAQQIVSGTIPIPTPPKPSPGVVDPVSSSLIRLQDTLNALATDIIAS